jgi:hypothetical protein
MKNMPKLSEYALREFGDFDILLLQELKGYLCPMKGVCAKPLEVSHTSPNYNFVRTVDDEPTHVYIHARAGF